METACLYEGLLEVSGTAGAADVMAQGIKPAGVQLPRAAPLLVPVSFPESIYPQIASPPPRG
jgi:hypothetical protein